jgi:hypothetical protein
MFCNCYFFINFLIKTKKCNNNILFFSLQKSISTTIIACMTNYFSSKLHVLGKLHSLHIKEKFFEHKSNFWKFALIYHRWCRIAMRKDM